MTEALIRDCKESDLYELISLFEAHAVMENYQYTSQGKYEKFKRLIGTEVVYIKLIEWKDQIAGYFTYTFDFSTWEAGYYLHLDCLFLKDEYRRKGIGKMIINYLQEVGVKNNCINIQWQTPQSNKDAIDFKGYWVYSPKISEVYKKCGALRKSKIRFYLSIL